MSEPFLGEIRVMSFPFAPRGWAFCNGQLMTISQNQALYSLIGTTYGGDGRTNFLLPNLQGRVPIHQAGGYPLGNAGGEQAHTLSATELPPHAHALNATSASGNAIVAPGNLLATTPNQLYHAPDGNTVAMNAASISPAGGGQAHANMMPYLTLNFCIALTGIFPTQN